MNRLPNPALILSVAVGSIIGLMLLVVFYLSFYEGLPGIPGGFLTTAHYTDLVKDPLVYRVSINTLIYTLTALFIAMLFGVLIAWLVERSDIRGRYLIYTAMTVSLLIPTFFPAMGWLFLLHPRIGFLNIFMRENFADYFKLNIATPIGMGWVEGITLAPVVFIMVAANLRMADTTLEEAATAAGANSWQLFKSIILPLSTPATLAATFYVATIAVASFDVPAIIGLSNRVYTLGTFIYEDLVPHQGFPLYGRPAAVSTMLIAVGILLSVWYLRAIAQANRYRLVTGKDYRPLRYRLGAWRFAASAFVFFYLIAQMLIPLGLLVWVAFQPYVQPPSIEALSQLEFGNFAKAPWDLFLRAVKNSAILTLGVPTMSIIICFAYSWVVLRSKTRLRKCLDVLAFLPHAVPSIVFGVAALLLSLFVLRQFIPLYGTLALLAIVHIVQRLSFGTRVANSAIIAVSEELEEAAEVCGARRRDIVARILLPLISPTLINAFFWIALLTLRELTLATILFSPDNITLSVVIWSLWSSGQHGPSAALSLIMILLMLPVMLLYWRVGNRVGESLSGIKR
ncbi:MAG: iron ABC transporter permease [Deltaproteobacteria bacterium]|nr:iron ABC transporter permease [Deltaproteobacteria bacterium]